MTDSIAAGPGLTAGPPVRAADGLRLGWVRRLWPILRPHRRSVALSFAIALVALAIQVAVPTLVGTTIDKAVSTDEAPLAPFLVALTVLALARGVLVVVYRFGLYRMAYRIEVDLRSMLYRHLSGMPFSFFDRVQTGQLLSRGQSDVRAVQLYLAVAPLIATSVISFAVALVVMLATNVGLTIAAVIALPGVYVVGVVLRNRLFPLSWIIQGRQAEVATVVEESVAGVRVVQSFAAEGARMDAMALAARRLRWANVEQGMVRARWSPLLENLPRVGSMLVLAYGGWLVIDGRLDVGSIIAFNAYIVLLQVPFRFLGFFLILGQRARASAERILEVLDEAPELTDPADPVDLPTPRGRLELRDVWFGYGDGPDVLRGVDLVVEPGETVAVVGATGSGKSTLARLLCRFYDPRRGTVLLDGVPEPDLALGAVRSAVVVVPDEPFLFSVPLRDNLAYGRTDVDDDELRAVAEAVDAHSFVEDLDAGYDTVVGERGYTLSGGQRQRVALGRALVVDPAVLVLDDATSAIDVQVEARIHRALRERRHDRTTVLIAHRLSTITLADRVVLLDGGRVVAEGTHAELLARVPRYGEILASGAGAA
ncbi:MAG: ABC transporter ATP-binding protein [Microthrixaceae bacterium]